MPIRFLVLVGLEITDLNHRVAAQSMQRLIAQQPRRPARLYSVLALAWLNGFLIGIASGTEPLPPANDNFQNRALLSGTHQGVVATNEGASLEAGEPLGCGGHRTLWWSWTAPNQGWVELLLTNGTASPCLRSYIGTSVNQLVEVPMDGNSFLVRSGVTYHLAADTDAAEGGTFSFGFRFRNAPSNDDFAHRTAIFGAPTSMFSSVTNASAEPGEPKGFGHSVWWTWHRVDYEPNPTRVVLDGINSSFNPEVRVWTGDSLPTLVEDPTFARLSPKSFAFTSHQGKEYQISVDGNGGSVAFSVMHNFVSSNDSLSQAHKFTFDVFRDRSDTLQATREPGEPNHFNRANGRSIWWQWRPPFDGWANLTVHSPKMTFRCAVYEGFTMGNLRLVTEMLPGASEVGFRAHDFSWVSIVVETPAEVPGEDMWVELSSYATPVLDQPWTYTEDPITGSVEFAATVRAEPWQYFTLEASTDLGNWLPVQTNRMLGFWWLDIKHREPKSPAKQFYRVRLQ